MLGSSSDVLVRAPYDGADNHGWREYRFGLHRSVQGMQTRESISLAVAVSRALGDGEIESGEEQGPAGLPGIQSTGFMEIL